MDPAACCCNISSFISIAVSGGLVASGEGTNAPVERAKEDESVKGEFAATGGAGKPCNPGGDSAVGTGPPGTGFAMDGVALIGGAPELNSAQRGHFLFVSVENDQRIE